MCVDIRPSMFAFDPFHIMDSPYRLARKSRMRKLCAYEKNRDLHVADTLKKLASWNLFELANTSADG